MVVKEKKSNIVKVRTCDGYYLFKLGNVLNRCNRTRYNLSRSISKEFGVVCRYSSGNLRRIDLEVIAKICDDCDCTLQDIIEYIPNSR